MGAVPFFRKYITSSPPNFFNNASEKMRRLKAYEKTWQAYLAELPDPIRVQDVDDNVRVNPVRAAINVGVYFLFGGGVKFEVSPRQTEELGVADSGELPDYLKDINRVWKANRKESLLNELGLSGGIHGQTFVKLLPRGAGRKGDLPRIVILDPSNVDVKTHPDDCKRVVLWSIQYVAEKEDGTPVTRTQEITPVYPSGTTEEDPDGTDALAVDPMPTAWEIADYEETWSHSSSLGWNPSGKRVPIGPVRQWPYAWPPIETCSNLEVPHSFWGLPDVDEASVDVVQAVQRGSSTLNKIMRLHGSPRMYAKGVMPELAAEIDMSPDNIITMPSAPGAESDLRVLQIVADISSFIDHIREMRGQLFEQIQTPSIALGQIDPNVASSLSGINLSIMFAPLVQKTDLKRVSYGDMLDRINYKLLMLMGYDQESEEYDDLTVTWPEAMPGSAYLERQTLIEDQKLGLSQYTAMERLGYDPDKERSQNLDEKRGLLELDSEFLAIQPGNVGVSGPDGSPQQATPAAKLGGKPKPANAPDETRGGNNNPTGKGAQYGGKMGATGNNTPKGQGKQQSK